MTAPAHEQKNPYLGSPARPWIALRFVGIDGEPRDIKLVVDTGCPLSFAISPDFAADFTFGWSTSIISNFGLLQDEWFQIAMPELGVEGLMVGFLSEEAADAVRLDYPEFAGLVGLPFLRLLDYGGNRDEFWVPRAD